MEEKVYQIWTVLSAFEESSAGCISEMLLHVSNGAYYDGVQMAEKFILHVEILFSAIDDLEIQMREAGDENEMAHGKDAKMLCKKIVNFFSLLSHTQESGVRRLGMTQELLSLVTGLAHYLKVLIRVALTCALTLEREHHSNTVIARFLNKLMELANRDKCLQDLHGKGTMDADVTSDLCLSCRTTIENECFTFDHLHRWHPKCLVCSTCAKPLADTYYEASFDAEIGSVLCKECKTPTSTTGFLHVTKLEQYTFLLRVALVRLESLLHLKDAEIAGEIEDQRGRHLTTPPTSGPLSPSNLIRKDSRSKSSSSEDYRPYENINLGDIKRVKSNHIDNNSGRFSRRQTVVAHHTGSSGTSEQQDARLNGGENGVHVHLIEDLTEDGVLPSEIQTAALTELTERLQINTTAANLSPSSSLRLRSNRSSRQGSQHFPSIKYPKRQYLNELSALELFMVKHLAVVVLEPIVSEYFTPEELLDLVPPDLAAILKDQDLVESSTDLSSKDILKRCENLIKAKANKAQHSTESHKQQSAHQPSAIGVPTPAAKSAPAKPEAATVTSGAIHSGLPNPIDIHRPNSLGREQSVHVLVQTPQSHHHHLSRPQTPISPRNSPPSSTLAPISITERPQVVTVGGGKGALPSSI
ncbi:hypothetical protein BGZ52_000926 [Haplosporangium bisporale]|nr:hypothetical protein BGZ52_000926 [Haplosporangium bisporale]